MEKLAMRLDLFGESETAGVTGASAGELEEAASEATAAPATEGVSANPTREGRRPNISPRVERANVQRAQPKRETVRQFPAAQTAAAPQQPQQQAAAAETWEDVKKRYKTEYGEDVRAAINERFKNQQDQSEQLSHAMQVLGSIAPFYGISADDAGNIDLDKLTKAIEDDDRFYEQAALEKGIPVETEKHIRHSISASIA